VEQSDYWETDCLTAGKENIPKTPRFIAVFLHFDPIHNFRPILFDINFNIILPSLRKSTMEMYSISCVQKWGSYASDYTDVTLCARVIRWRFTGMYSKQESEWSACLCPVMCVPTDVTHSSRTRKRHCPVRPSICLTLHFSNVCTDRTALLLHGYSNYTRNLPVTMAARSKAGNVFGVSNTGNVGWNPTQGTDVCLPLCCPV
jgi:hypothetical protein